MYTLLISALIGIICIPLYPSGLIELFESINVQAGIIGFILAIIAVLLSFSKTVDSEDDQKEIIKTAKQLYTNLIILMGMFLVGWLGYIVQLNWPSSENFKVGFYVVLGPIGLVIGDTLYQIVRMIGYIK